MNILIKKNYEHYVNTETRITLQDSENYNFYIVYFINCTINPNYMDWLVNQINLVKDFGGNIYIISTISEALETEFRINVKKFFPKVYIECYYENEYEYRGILKVWELGQVNNKKNDIILYFHSKGITHHQNYEFVKNDNHNVILQDINKITEIFSIFPDIDKVGYSSGGLGWIWYNFWYARGSYVNRVEKPLKTERRHYYEDWLARKVEIGDEFSETERSNVTYYKNTLKNCYGFFTDQLNIANIGSYFAVEDGEYKKIM